MLVVGEGEDDGDAVGVAVAVGVGDAEVDGRGEEVAVAVGVGEVVGRGVDVAVAVGVGEAVAAGDAVGEAVGVVVIDPVPGHVCDRRIPESDPLINATEPARTIRILSATGVYVYAPLPV